MSSDRSSEPHDAEALGPGEHRRILARYRAAQTGAGWHTAPDDGYLYANLAYHLAALAATDPDAAQELQNLFADHNWLHARTARWGSPSGAHYDGYLEDLARYWGTVQRILLGELAAGERCTALVDGIWCALLASSVAVLTSPGTAVSTPDDVEFGLWSGLLAHDVPISLLDAGRKAALRVQEPAARCAALLLVADELEGTGQAQAFGAALAAAQEVGSVAARALLLGKLGGLRTGLARRKVLLGALLTLHQVTDWRIHATVLGALAPHLDGSLMVMALAAVRKIDENLPRMRALTALLACPDAPARRSAWLQIAGDLCYRFRSRPRAELYACLALPGLLAPPCVDAEMAAAIAAAAMRLEADWQWPPVTN